MSFIESTCFDVKETGVLPDFFTLFFGAIRTRTHNALPQTLNALKSDDDNGGRDSNGWNCDIRITRFG